MKYLLHPFSDAGIGLLIWAKSRPAGPLVFTTHCYWSPYEIQIDILIIKVSDLQQIAISGMESERNLWRCQGRSNKWWITAKNKHTHTHTSTHSCVTFSQSGCCETRLPHGWMAKRDLYKPAIVTRHVRHDDHLDRPTRSGAKAMWTFWKSFQHPIKIVVALFMIFFFFFLCWRSTGSRSTAYLHERRGWLWMLGFAFLKIEICFCFFYCCSPATASKTPQTLTRNVRMWDVLTSRMVY